ncbi:alpha/beta fold hydrolase [Saprospira sp. CCB-QB6]|uniref:alpha/beta fold hydrolase n=1 Tax=Saprospira sp. CCB-QB6 TaxID=3023936 RepID=UPI00234A8750|nr:alpha/beta fold hydrolase [Saprospira sp. CCB-QB6]WCL82083.1 alpha/beta fold hydrolase [Saprospira sp. CCB-QB6]
MKLNFKQYGAGKPIVIMHGMFGMLDNWQYVAKELAEEYMVFLVDLRNHGKSPHSEEFSYALMADDVRKFMEENWLYEAKIVGHSMGGKVAMQLALEEPDMVEQLVVVDIAPKSYRGNHETIIAAMQSLPLGELENRSAAEAHLRKSIHEEGVVQFLLKNLSRERTGGYRWKMNLPVIASHYREILANSLPEEQYEGPTLFIQGLNSHYINPEELSDYQHYFPAAQITPIADAGHWVHAEQPQAFLAALRKFFT